MYTECHKPKKILKHLKQITVMLLFPFFLFAEGGFAPIMVGDITIFVPYTKVSVSLGADKTLGENEVQLLRPSITHKEEIRSYEWSEGGTVLGTGATFSTANLDVGTHTLTLRVTDINGIVTTDEMTVTIQEYVTGDDFVGTTKGEFLVNQGVASYNLKIAVPPGVAGMEPKLSLSYSSSAGNGYMGVGWNIDGVSSITRCSQTRATDGTSHTFGVKYNSNDRFCLDGQRLINVKGSYGKDNTEYRTEINNYSKIISRSSYAGGPKYFDVYTKSGLRYIYGANASTYSSHSGTAKIAWKVDRIIDTYGNTIYFAYKKDSSKGSHYLDKVSYADNTVQYVYETREDSIKGYENGHPYETTKRLKELVVKTGSKEIRRYKVAYSNEATGIKPSKVTSITEHVAGTALKSLKFTHAPKGQASFKKGVSWIRDFGSDIWKADKHLRTMSDVNGDGLPDVVGFGSDAVYVSLNNGSGFDSKTKWSSNFTYANGWKVGKHQRLVTDVNGDGIPDLVGFADIGVHVGLGTGKGFATIKKWSNDFGSNIWSADKYIRNMADVNGDGLPDIVGFGWDAVWVSLNTKNGFAAPARWNTTNFTYKSGWRVGRHQRMLRDVNGDGLPDIVGFGDTGVYVALSTGKGFGSTLKWSNDYGSSVWDSSKHIRSMADVNGDGLPDIVGFGNAGMYVGLNTGKGFKSGKTWSYTFGADKWSMSKHVRMLSDVNGDGLEDVVGFGDTGVYVALSTGKGFASAKKWVSDFSYANYCWRVSKHERLLPDVDGDGLPDVVGFGGSATYVGINNQKKAVLTRITNATDQDIKISYGKMINNKTLYHNYSQNKKRNAYAWNKIANDNIELSLPMSLVSSVSTIDGVGGYNKLRYKYYGYIANKLRGLQGFHAVVTYDDTRQSNSGVFYKQIEKPNGVGFQYTGMPYLNYEAEGLTPSWAKVFSKTDIVYKDASTRAKVYEPYTNTNVETIYDPKTKKHIKSVYQTNTMSTNGLGNISKKVIRTYDVVNGKNFYKTIDNKYDLENTAKWQIGRLSKATVTHTQTDGGTVVRSSTFKYNTKGLLSEEVANAGTTLALKKTYLYNSQGNKVSQTVSGSKITTATTRFGYSSDGKFQTSVTDATGLTSKKTYDARFGTVTSATSPAGITTRWYYDNIGRKLRERRADGTSTAWLYKWYGSANINSSYVHYVTTLRSAVPNSYVYFDSLGRERTSFTTTLGGKRLRTSFKYFNKKGEVYKERLPYIEGVGTIGYINTTYDNYGRPTQVSKPGPSGVTQTTKSTYKDFTTTITNPAGIEKQVVKNAMGQVMHTTDAYGESVASKMTYEYDALGQLKKTTDQAGNKISMYYDAQGNKTSMNDPDLGVWQYRYRADGKLDTQWSGSAGHAKSKHFTKIKYDVLGRVTQKEIYDLDSKNTKGANAYTYNKESFYYDTKTGRIRKTDFSSRQDANPWTGGYNIPKYDSLGRVTETKKHIYYKGDFLSKVSYDAYSRPSTMTYPNGYSVTNHYSYGILNKVTGSDGKVHYKINKLTALGQVADATYANGVRTAIGYDNAGYIGSIRSGKNGSYYTGSVQNMVYTYDTLGNVKTRNDFSVVGKYIKDTYSYDKMNRLVSQNMSTNVTHASLNSTSYRYDSIGNMTYKSGIGTYTYNTDKPHAVKKAGSRTYTYDAVGNMTNRNGDNIAYNAMNLPSILTGKNGKTVKFHYDTSGQRYLKESNGIKTYYLGKSYEEEVQANNTNKKQTCYINIGGKTVGSHVEVIDETYSINKSNPKYKSTYNRYFHSDALGSITSITDDAGTVVERRSYEAFGKIRPMVYKAPSSSLTSTVSQTNRAYTGHEQIQEIEGLIHMNARVYDSEIGRFLSADTLIQDPHDSQAYNRYSYVRNNPMNLTDPSGHSWLSKKWKKFKKQLKRLHRFVKRNIKTIIVVAAVVVVSILAPPVGAAVVKALGLTGTTASVVAGATTGAIVGATAGGVGTAVNGGNLKDILRNMGKGAIAGGIGGAVGGYYGDAWNLGRVGAQATANGVGSEIMGGRFKDGFKMGAVTAGARLFYNRTVGYDVTLEGGDKAVMKDPLTMPKQGDMNFGIARRTPLDARTFWEEGGTLSRAANKIPGMNSLAGIHDVFQVDFDLMQGTQDGLLRTLGNVPAMVPAAVINYTALASDFVNPYTVANNTRRK